MKYIDNTIYTFLPFRLESCETFSALKRGLSTNNRCHRIRDDNKYLLKFVAEKVDDEALESECQCIHYLYKEKDICDGENKMFFTGIYKEKEVKFELRMTETHIYCFSTGIGIVAIKHIFEKSDSMWISTAEYYLKKVSNTRIFTDEGVYMGTQLDIVKKIIEDLCRDIVFDFFFYSNKGNERANILTYIEEKASSNFYKDLFYLKHGYREGFVYEEKKEDCFRPTKDTFWGITAEIAVCMKCPEYGQGDFIRNTFYENFCTQYLFMYVYLLHQKYVLYMFQTRAGNENYENLDILESYRKELYEFESNFVFSVISEIPQYQSLYEMLSDAFSLKKMYNDVHEPLQYLSEIRQKELDEKSKAQDDNINNALILLSLLSLFSALIDSFDFAQSFFAGKLGLGAGTVFAIQCGAILLSILIVIFVIMRIIRAKHK